MLHGCLSKQINGRGKRYTHYLRAAVPAGVLKAGLSLLVGSVSETRVFNLPLDKQKQQCLHKAHILRQSQKPALL